MCRISQEFALDCAQSRGLERRQPGRVMQRLVSRHARERLRRFLQLYPRVAASGQGAFEYVDLRYSNGFAMKWPGQDPVPLTPPAPPATPEHVPVEDA